MNTPDAITLTALTPRQLDHLTRQPYTARHLPGLNPGSGGRRDWTYPQVTKLMVCERTITLIPGLALAAVALTILPGPTPPPAGWVILDLLTQAVHYWPATGDMADVDHRSSQGALVAVPYDLEALAADRGMTGAWGELSPQYDDAL